jgi:hypothetical protein
LCADAGFDPRIGYSSDDMVVITAALLAALAEAAMSTTT